ncbi:MAG TPA: DNA polymerase III subunit alpha [Pyrinomonadaceae bacterium]|nr:DNA polymerase III subunit alpha [Pyrinomonadaceae bacterium]
MDQLNFKSRDFVHLHLHSDYSLLQSTIKLKPLANRLGELGMQACGLTDYGNMYGAVSFYKTMKEAKVRPIIGYEAFVASGSRFDRDLAVRAGERPYYNLVLLATNDEGYQNLVYLSSKAFTEGLLHKPRLDSEILAERSAGLIALSAGANGGVAHFLRQGDESRAREVAEQYKSIFGKDFYIEIADNGTDESRSLTRSLIDLARKSDISLVAANDAHYLNKDDARAHEVLLCIGDGRTLSEDRYTFSSSNYYLRSSDEMWEIFGSEVPEALTNTLSIAEQCQLEIAADGDNFTLPVYPIPDTDLSRDEYFEWVVSTGLEERKQKVFLPMREAGTLRYSMEDYSARITREFSVIRKMGFQDYFLITWDFIKYAKENNIPVGPGRGSAAGSLVAYCLGITDIDPLQYDLLFERFLNPERISMPDIDIDFCIRGRGDVINHVTKVYGRESVCQIITFGTMASRAAIKDVGRALNMPYGDVEKIAKLIPPPIRGRNVSISQATEMVPELKAAIGSDPKVKDLVELALRLEGCARHSSVHAAGVVISPKPLHEIVPVAVSAKDELTSQYSMNDLEKVGMLKMDFLALTTLTVINDCLLSLKARTGIEIDWGTIPLNDEKTMQLFGDGRTDAVFQFESGGMQEICRKLKPKELEDLSALNALYRPGPIDGGMIDDYIARHRGEKQVRYLIPQMKEILENTYGVLVYQEQIMQLAQKLAGYSLGEADMMRRAMGKKKREEMAVHEEKFISGAVGNGIAKDKAESIFKLMAQFADYGFNRSHSIAYAYLAFQTAYLKAHYPAYFYAAVLSHEADDSAKVYKYSTELRSMGLRLLPPDVNESDEGFTPSDEAVRFGLSAIKGIGASTVKAVVDARQEIKFTSLFDFVSRIDQGAIGRRGLESLITSGAFDSLIPESTTVGQWRANLFAGIDVALSVSQKAWSDRERGQNALFGTDSATDVFDEALPTVRAWTQTEISAQEKAAVGFYLSVHPLDNYKDIVKGLRISNIVDHGELRAGETIVLAGIVSSFQVRQSKKGNRFCMFRFEDESGGVKCLAWSEAYGKYSPLLKNDELLIIEGRVESAEGQDITIIMNEARSLKEALPGNAKSVDITLPVKQVDDEYLHDLLTILNNASGKCEVYLEVAIDEVKVKLHSQPIRIQGSTHLETQLRNRGCEVNWIL